jgi:hypothetical protein
MEMELELLSDNDDFFDDFEYSDDFNESCDEFEVEDIEREKDEVIRELQQTISDGYLARKMLLRITEK